MSHCPASATKSAIPQTTLNLPHPMQTWFSHVHAQEMEPPLGQVLRPKPLASFSTPLSPSHPMSSSPTHPTGCTAHRLSSTSLAKSPPHPLRTEVVSLLGSLCLPLTACTPLCTQHSEPASKMSGRSHWPWLKTLRQLPLALRKNQCPHDGLRSCLRITLPCPHPVTMLTSANTLPLPNPVTVCQPLRPPCRASDVPATFLPHLEDSFCLKGSLDITHGFSGMPLRSLLKCPPLVKPSLTTLNNVTPPPALSWSPFPAYVSP